jgi:hypothetical protein
MKRLTAALTLALALAALSAVPAQAAFGLNGFDVHFEEENGSPATKAGSHPFAMETIFDINFHEEEPGVFAPDEELKSLEVELPVGFAGNPTAMPTCTRAQFLKLDPETSTPACPDKTAVGVVVPKIINPGYGAPRAVFNLERPPGTAAEIGFVIAREPVTIDVGVRKSPPYNVSAAIVNIPQAAKFYGSKLIIWGNPANPAHDEQRGSCIVLSGADCPAGVPEKPFLTLPRACSGPLFTTYAARSWQSPAAPAVTGASEAPLELSECEALDFGPTIEAQPTTAAGQSASGLDFELKVDDPELSSPTGTAAADIKKVVATLPAGITVNPSAAEGQEACSAAQYAAESLTGPGGCPPAAKVGGVEVKTPLLEGEVLEGSVYLADQDDNPFDTLLALYIVIKDPKLGILVKQAGKVEPDPVSGQLTSTFEDVPQLPFSSFLLHMRSGPRAPLITPASCGAYETKALLTPWNGKAPVTATSSFEVISGPGGGPCLGLLPFHPGFSAGTLQSAATTYSPYAMRLTRSDGEQEMTRLSATLPPGVVGKIAGLAKCPEAAVAAARAKSGRQEIASPSCPASSLVGHLSAGAGVGADLTYVAGKLYLAGPFAGDPLSIVAITPGVAGPLDVGNVVLREALDLDPKSAEVIVDGVVSDPIPRILAGIPLRLRDVRVITDRPQFTTNASGCDPAAAKATLFGSFADPFNPADDVGVALADRYQATACSTLGFGPKLSLALKGGTKRAKHPSLRSVLTYPYPSGPGYSNIGDAVVILPRSQQIDNAHVNNPCTRVQFNANQCPPSSVLGYAKAVSPLLDAPLEGPVYFRSNGGERELPDIVADLKGQFRIILVGFVDTVTPNSNPRIRTTFAGVPDAPVTEFTLNLFGGKRGLLVNNQNICAKTQRSTVRFTAHNNALKLAQQKVATSCKKTGKGKGKGKKRGR